MRTSWKVLSAALCGLFLVGIVLGTGQEDAQARPKYLIGFAKKYPDLLSKAKEKKCLVCHPVKKDGKIVKTIRNDYGHSLHEALPKENLKDLKKIDATLGKIEDEKSTTEGKTFGDLIKAGKLPGDNDKQFKDEDDHHGEE